MYPEIARQVLLRKDAHADVPGFDTLGEPMDSAAKRHRGGPIGYKKGKIRPILPRSIRFQSWR